MGGSIFVYLIPEVSYDDVSLNRKFLPEFKILSELIKLFSVQFLFAPLNKSLNIRDPKCQ